MKHSWLDKLIRAREAFNGLIFMLLDRARFGEERWEAYSDYDIDMRSLSKDPIEGLRQARMIAVSGMPDEVFRAFLRMWSGGRLTLEIRNKLMVSGIKWQD